MSAKRARRLQEQHDFLGRPEESRPGVLIPHFFGAVFQSRHTHLNPHPIPSHPHPRNPLCYLDILSARCQRQWRHRGICSDQIMFHKRSHLWRMTTAMTTAAAMEQWFVTILKLFELFRDSSGRWPAICGSLLAVDFFPAFVLNA